MIFKKKEKAAHEGATKVQTNNTIEDRVLQALKNVDQVKRYDLVSQVGGSDVKVRQAIANLQLTGAPIINLQDGRGYKLAATPEELEAYKAQETARARQILKKVKAMRLEG